MLIDWFTVVAQAVNFLILVWLLQRFLYRPILNAIEAREQRIAAELADADAKRADAQTEREKFQRKNAEFDRQHAALLDQATQEAAAERQRLFDAARNDAEKLRARQQDKLRSEYQSLQEAIARSAQAEVFAIARKTLTDLAGASLEAQMVEVFVLRLRGLDSAEKVRLTAALPASGESILVRSAFELPAAQRARIENAIKETLAAETQIRFELAPDQISGIELTMQGQKIAWSIAAYLASLDKSVNELLKAQPQAATTQSPDEHAG